MTRTLLGAIALAALAGCPTQNEDTDTDAPPDVEEPELTVEEFAEQFATVWCEAQTACCTDPDGAQPGCDAITEAACGSHEPEEGGDDVACDFDVAAAEDCLAGAFECDEEAGYVTPPAACATVCGSVEEDTGSDEDTDPIEDKECVNGDNFTADGSINVTLRKDGTQFAWVETNVGELGFVPFDTYLCGNTGSVVLNIYETGLLNGWDEQHALTNTDHDVATPDYAAWDRWAETLTHTDDIGEVDNTHTLFNSDDDPVGSETGTLTYVLRAYDGTNSLQDCIIWGDNPAYVLADTFPSLNNTTTQATDTEDINGSNCAEVSF